ncbi:hypothetical protein CAP35_00565 [Chitinophagaceae bacterium IBVUCB1]|nr:hypothetical protein CAP35_00565 [Chitinophagaceae bacterium IBVUCB1]
MKRNYTDIIMAAVLILAVAAMRIITAELRLPNYTPVEAVGLFAGAVILDKKYAYILPLLTMFIADTYFQFFTTVNGFYGFEQVIVYIAMALVTFMGTKMGKINGIKVLGYSITGSFVFFALSNFSYFLAGWNGYTTSGFIKTYIDALEFYRTSLTVNLVGSIVLFGLYFTSKNVIARQPQNA